MVHHFVIDVGYLPQPSRKQKDHRAECQKHLGPILDLLRSLRSLEINLREPHDIKSRVYDLVPFIGRTLELPTLVTLAINAFLFESMAQMTALIACGHHLETLELRDVDFRKMSQSVPGAKPTFKSLILGPSELLRIHAMGFPWDFQDLRHLSMVYGASGVDRRFASFIEQFPRLETLDVQIQSLAGQFYPTNYP